MAIETTATSARVVCSNGYASALDPADEPESGGVAHRTPVEFLTGGLRAAPLPLAAFAVALIAVWFLADPRTPDLAAQVYRVRLFGELGPAVWDARWYAGHHLPGYSLMFPPLGSLLGTRLLGAASALASTLLFERLIAPVYPRAARWAAAWFAVAAVGDIWIGRLTFALGLSFALAAALALRGRRDVLAAVLAVACAAASPVAGVLLGLAALTLALEQRSLRAPLLLGAPAAAVVLVLALLFPEGGWEPFPLRSFIATAVVVLAFLWAIGRGQRLLRIGAAVYLLACVFALAIHSPLGSNIERYGVLLSGPLLLCASLRSPAQEGAAARGVAGLRPPVLLALLVSALWVAWGPVRETAAVAGSPATSAAYYVPVERFLEGVPDRPARVEVPLTRSHWEAALLAPSISLARGWEKQLETRYDHVLLASGMSAAGYRAWLREQAVGYVALPDVALDPSSAREGLLIRGGLPYLQEVFASRHWRVYRVRSATPLLSGPGRLLAIGHDSFSLSARAPGSLIVRVRFTPYWTLLHGYGCVREASGGWTEVRLDAPGPATVAARFSLARAVGDRSSCAGTAGA